ncbi:hypothetical protein [Massilia eburnea]|uniref:hypothetical protein n=1 Tax=Massilia eburnea TaxID=1776165 RepID=UPI003D6B773F
MQPPYLTHPAKELLDEFGAGRHVPGAGSASALGSLRDLRAESIEASQPQGSSEPLIGFGTRAKQGYSNEEIEDRARRLGLQMWQRKAQIWAGASEPSDPIKVLDPERALGLLGYSYELAANLGTIKHGTASYEVAGVLEARKRKASTVWTEKPPPAMIEFWHSSCAHKFNYGHKFSTSH